MSERGLALPQRDKRVGFARPDGALVVGLHRGSDDLRKSFLAGCGEHGCLVEMTRLGQRPQARGRVQVCRVDHRCDVNELDLQQGPQREALLGETPLVGDGAERERRVLHVATFGEGCEVAGVLGVGEVNLVVQASVVDSEPEGLRQSPPQQVLVEVLVARQDVAPIAQRLGDSAGSDPLDEPAEVL